MYTNLKQNEAQSACAESRHKGVHKRSKDVKYDNKDTHTHAHAHTHARTRTHARTHTLRMYLWWSLCTLYLHACQVRVTVGDSGLCCCTCVTYFER